MSRMKAPGGNRLDFERYFFKQKCFVLQADFHNWYVFIEIYKVMLYFVSKHFRHVIGSIKALGWKPFTDDEVLCLYSHPNPRRP